MSTPVLEPAEANLAATMLAEASRQRLLVVPRGSGTKLGLTNDEANVGAYLSTKRLNAPVQHFAGDLVATIPSGVTLVNANAVLAEAGQWLPLDPSHAERATIGGIVATNDSGPRRHRYGSPRDLIIGVELALCDGRVAKAGGRVVKNVAGYDLSRLVCGSFGSLAVITSATFKLAPLAPTSRTVVATCSDVAEAARLALAIAAQPITPSALETAAPSAQLLIRFETTEQAAEEMAATTQRLLHENGATTDVLANEAERDVWRRHEASIWEQPGVVVKISVLPTEVQSLLGGAFPSGLDWSAIGRAALGVLLVRINAPGGNEAGVVARLCQQVSAKKGTLVVLRKATEHGQLASTPQIEGSLATVMKAVKAQFDPNGVLPPLPGLEV
jgi:glycolate dehydrogenase FAD-binding subunit